MVDSLPVLDGALISALLLVIACLFMAFVLAIRQRRKQDQFFSPDFVQ
jgi:hypothetical protein